ncbi:hypothetical protein KY290_032133 [Solanum tuberosum]|uniref:Uncharacterized protein n=1 Tax=Solanum tuberosum TaxID=4113 RepID=A0ABQ7UEN7_SOLTU|nr:hypothetical protein KY290_032133 [Solanum tuberosum]
MAGIIRRSWDWPTERLWMECHCATNGAPSYHLSNGLRLMYISSVAGVESSHISRKETNVVYNVEIDNPRYILLCFQEA